MPLLIPLRDKAPMTSSRGRPALASPITRRCPPDMTPEHAGQMLLVRKSAAMGNLRDGLLRVAKQIFRPLDPAAHHILMRRHSHLGSELPGEVRHAHRGEIAQILEAQSHLQRVFAIVRHHPQPMPAKSMPCRLGLHVAATLSDHASRYRTRTPVPIPPP